jgi:hypothetical protein
MLPDDEQIRAFTRPWLGTQLLVVANLSLHGVVPDLDSRHHRLLLLGNPPEPGPRPRPGRAGSCSAPAYRPEAEPARTARVGVPDELERDNGGHNPARPRWIRELVALVEALQQSLRRDVKVA